LIATTCNARRTRYMQWKYASDHDLNFLTLIKAAYVVPQLEALTLLGTGFAAIQIERGL
jgi:hypothetical protein